MVIKEKMGQKPDENGTVFVLLKLEKIDDIRYLGRYHSKRRRKKL